MYQSNDALASGGKCILCNCYVNTIHKHKQLLFVAANYNNYPIDTNYAINTNPTLTNGITFHDSHSLRAESYSMITNFIFVVTHIIVGQLIQVYDIVNNVNIQLIHQWNGLLLP